MAENQCAAARVAAVTSLLLKLTALPTATPAFLSTRLRLRATSCRLHTEISMTSRLGVIFALVFGLCVTDVAKVVKADPVALPSATMRAVGGDGSVSETPEAADTPTERANAAWEAKDWELAAKL